MVSAEDRKALNVLAKEKGYNCLLIFPPTRLAIMRRGTVLSTYTDKESCEAAISLLEPFTFIPPNTSPVGWTVDPQLFPAPPKQCPNQGGTDCLCLTNGDDGLRILCTVAGCEWLAECKGSCPPHYGHIKLFGDLTQQAIIKTQQVIERPDEATPCVHGEVNHHSYEQILDRWDRGERQKIVSLKQMTRTSENSATRSAVETKALSELLGVIIRPTGDGFAVYDKNGTVLAYDLVRADLLELFYGE